MKFIIRKAEKKDLPFIMKLYSESLEIKSITIGEKEISRFESFINSETQTVIVGEKNGEIVSVLNLNVFYSFVNGIYPFAVAEGIAVKGENEDMITMMLSKAQEIALLHGCTQMQITESKNNALKNYTYLKFGFDNVHADAYIKSY